MASSSLNTLLPLHDSSWRDKWFEVENQFAMGSTTTSLSGKAPSKAGKLAKVLLAATAQAGFTFTNVTQAGGYGSSMSRVQRQHGQGQNHCLLYFVTAAIAVVFAASFTAVLLRDEKPEIAATAEKTGAVVSVLAFLGMVAIFFLSV